MRHARLATLLPFLALLMALPVIWPSAASADGNRHGGSRRGPPPSAPQMDSPRFHAPAPRAMSAPRTVPFSNGPTRSAAPAWSQGPTRSNAPQGYSRPPGLVNQGTRQSLPSTAVPRATLPSSTLPSGSWPSATLPTTGSPNRGQAATPRFAPGRPAGTLPSLGSTVRPRAGTVPSPTWDTSRAGTTPTTSPNLTLPSTQTGGRFPGIAGSPRTGSMIPAAGVRRAGTLQNAQGDAVAAPGSVTPTLGARTGGVRRAGQIGGAGGGIAAPSVARSGGVRRGGSGDALVAGGGGAAHAGAVRYGGTHVGGSHYHHDHYGYYGGYGYPYHHHHHYGYGLGIGFGYGGWSIGFGYGGWGLGFGYGGWGYGGCDPCYSYVDPWPVAYGPSYYGPSYYAPSYAYPAYPAPQPLYVEPPLGPVVPQEAPLAPMVPAPEAAPAPDAVPAPNAFPAPNDVKPEQAPAQGQPPALTPEEEKALGESLEAFRSGSYGKAHALLEGLVANNPQLGNAWMGIAHAAFAAGRTQRAAEALTKASLLGAFPRGYRFDPATLYASPEAFKERRQALDTRLTEKPDDADAHLVAAWLHLSVGERDAARQHLSLIHI